MTEYHEQLILKLLGGSITPNEQQTLSAWMEESEENQKLVNDFISLWRASENKLDKPDFQTAEEWKKFETAIVHEKVKSVKQINFYKNAPALKVAASIGVIALFSWILYLVVFSHETILKESGETTLQITLPDGSAVWLNKNSRLAYDDNFDVKSRTVILSGEAFFEVKSDPQKPFVVQTTRARVKVLGTSFNVKTDAEGSKATEVFVVTGLVNFSNIKGANKGIDLKAGELAATGDNTVVLMNDGDSNILAWKEKRLIFQKSSLHTVVRNLETYFKIEMEIKNEDISRCRFTGSFDQPTLEEIIEALSVSLDLTIVKKDDIYILDGDGC